jgi:hypothetical protein
MLPRMPLKTLAYVALLMMVVSCDSSGPKFTQIRVDGTVTDAATGSSITGASVSIVHYPDGPFQLVGTPLQSTNTDASGRYSLTHLGCARTPYVQVFASGYFVDDHEIGCMADAQVLDFHLARSP